MSLPRAADVQLSVVDEQKSKKMIEQLSSLTIPRAAFSISLQNIPKLSSSLFDFPRTVTGSEPILETKKIVPIALQSVFSQKMNSVLNEKDVLISLGQKIVKLQNNRKSKSASEFKCKAKIGAGLTCAFGLVTMGMLVGFIISGDKRYDARMQFYNDKTDVNKTCSYLYEDAELTFDADCSPNVVHLLNASMGIYDIASACVGLACEYGEMDDAVAMYGYLLIGFVIATLVGCAPGISAIVTCLSDSDTPWIDDLHLTVSERIVMNNRGICYDGSDSLSDLLVSVNLALLMNEVEDVMLSDAQEMQAENNPVRVFSK